MRISAGSGFNIHVLTKATASANSFGPQSSLKFGKEIFVIIFNYYCLADVLVTTPNRLVHMLSLDPPGIVLDKLVF